MISIGCPWCDHQLSLSPQAFADEALVCNECSTRIDLAVGPATLVVAVEPREPALLLAA